jgi:Resolvase, N terminal domain
MSSKDSKPPGIVGATPLPAETEGQPRAAAYLRTAPKDATALVGQLERVLEAQSKSGHFVPWELVVAETAGGYRRSQRALLAKLVVAAGSGRFVMIAVSDLTGLGRDLHDVLRIIDALFVAGVDVSWPHFPSLRADTHQCAFLKGFSEWLAVALLNQPGSWGIRVREAKRRTITAA